MSSSRNERKRDHCSSGESTSKAQSTRIPSIGRSSGSTSKSVGTRSGRPSLRLSLPVRRCLTRLYITTDEPLSHIEEAIAKAGGPKKLWVRQRLQEITGLDKGSGLSLDDLRLDDKDAIHKREDEQREAMCIDKSRRTEAAAMSAELNVSMRRVAGQFEPMDTREASMSKPAIAPQTLFTPHLGSGQPGFNLSASRRIPTSESVNPAGNVSLSHSALPTTVSPIHAATSQALMTWSNGQDDSTWRPIRNRRRASAISVSSVTRCLVSKKRSVCSFVAKRCSISVLSVQSRTSSSFSLSRLRRPSTYQQFYALPGDTEGDTAVEMLMTAKNKKHSDIKTRDKLRERLSHLPDDSERQRYVRASDQNHVTALHLAVAYGYPAVCCILLDNGANYKARTVQGETPTSFAKSAQNAAGQEESLLQYSHIMLCRDRVKYNINPPIPGGEKKEESEARPLKRRKTSQTVGPSRQYHLPYESTSSLPERTDQESVCSLSTEDLSWPAAPGIETGPDQSAAPPSVPMSNLPLSRTQESLHLGRRFTDSPVSTSFPIHPLHRVSTLDFAAIPSCTTSTRRPVPRMPIRRDAMHPSTRDTSFRRPAAQESLDHPASSALCNNSSSGQDTSVFPMTTETNLFDDREAMPKVLLGGFDTPVDQDDEIFAAQAAQQPSPPQQQSSYQNNNAFVAPQDLMHRPSEPFDRLDASDQANEFYQINTFNQTNALAQANALDLTNAFDRTDAFDQANVFGQSNALDETNQFADFNAAWPDNAVPTETYMQPIQNQLSFQPQNAATIPNPAWLPLTSNTASHGMQTTGTQTIWYDCPHNNPTSVGRSMCQFGCTPMQAIYGLGM